MSRRSHISFAISSLALLWVVLAAPAANAGQFAYVSGFDDGQIAAGRVDAGGVITTLGSSPFVTDSPSLEGIAISPDGRRALTAGFNDGQFSGFSISGSGKLTSLDGSPQTMATGGYGVTVTPNGKFAYASGTSDNEVTGFKISKGGKLSNSQGSTSVPDPTGLAISSSGKYLYVATQTSPGEIYAFRIGGNGSLTAVSGSPFPTGPGPFAIALAPNGKNLFVADRNSPAFIHSYATAGDGSLTELASSPVPADGGNPFGMAISPDGRSLYTANYESDTISGFSIAGDGALAALPGSVYPGPEDPAALTLNASGEKLYAVSANAAMTTYDIGTDGVPENKIFALFGTTGDFQSIALTPAQPPKAKLKAPKKAEAGDPVKLSAKKSKDDGDIVEYAWKFGDGKKTFTMGPKVKHNYAQPGKYKVTVTLTDDDGCSTKYVSTGQTAYCNGGKKAKTTETVKVGK